MMKRLQIIVMAFLSFSQLYPLCINYQKELMDIDNALTKNTTETTTKKWVISAIKAIEGTLINCLNVKDMPKVFLDHINQLTEDAKNFKETLSIIVINFSIYLAMLESHPEIKLFCSSPHETCDYPSILSINKNYFSKQYFQNLIKRMIRILPYADNLSQTPFIKPSTPSQSASCTNQCDFLKSKLSFSDQAPIVDQLQDIERSLNACIDFYGCSQAKCTQSEIISGTALTQQQQNTALTNFEIRLAVIESHPAINAFCPTPSICAEVGFIATLDNRQRLQNLCKRLIRIWSLAQKQFPTTCKQETPEIERHELDKKETEPSGGDGDDSEEADEQEKRESDIRKILK